jgi:Ca2+-binding RTX toxin-like protein
LLFFRGASIWRADQECIMTTVNYLTKTELPGAFNTGNFDLASQQAVIKQLIADGLYDNSNPDDGKAVWVESDIFQGVPQPPLFDSGGNSKVPNFIQVLEVEGTNVTVNTDKVLDIIVDDGNGPNNILNVIGHNNAVFVALGNSNTTVNLTEHGNDTVLAGNGNDSITANDGKDVLIGGSGADTLQGGSGADSLYAGSGANTLMSGTGQHQLLVGGSGSDHITDRSSNGTDTLVAGTGNDTINGIQGDNFALPSGTMVASGNDVYNIYDGHGNSTINLGTGSDVVNFFTTAGKDTITTSGSGTDTVNYQHSSTNLMADIKSITPGTGAESGDYLIKFKDGQSVDLIGHGVSSSKVAFTLEFHDGTINLKGGS